MCAEGHRPICQDTGIIMVFLFSRHGAALGPGDHDIDDMVNEGVRRAYTDPDNQLRESIVSDPVGAREDTHDNTPAIIHTRARPRKHARHHVSRKAAAPRRRRMFAMLNPSDSVVDWVLQTVPHDGCRLVPAGHARHRHWRYAEKAMELAKKSLMEPLDMHELRHAAPATPSRSCAWRLHERSMRSASALRD